MAEYKRKRRSNFKSAPKRINKKVKDVTSDIQMHSESEPKLQKMRIVKGKKLENKRKFKFFSRAVCIVGIVLIVCQLIMPAGVVETVSNSLNLLGTGKYPISLESNDVINVVSKGSYYYVLTDTKLNAISNSGKVIYSHSHGFENPVLKTSKTRALLFDQGKESALIFNLSGLTSNITLKNKIINGTIGANGSYAFITSSESYVSQVSVYKKNDKLVYEWYSAEDLINNVAISDNGKKIAISTISSNVGSYDSKISILNFKSANAEYSKDYKNTIIYSIDNSVSRGFSVLSSNAYDFISWRGKNSAQYSNEYSADILRNCANGTVAVFNRENDKTDNRVVIFSKNGKMKNKIEFKEIITDIALKGNNVYCLSDTNVYILDTKGNIVRKENSGFGVERISVIGQNKIVAVTDNSISEIKLK